MHCDSTVSVIIIVSSLFGMNLCRTSWTSFDRSVARKSLLHSHTHLCGRECGNPGLFHWAQCWRELNRQAKAGSPQVMQNATQTLLHESPLMAQTLICSRNQWVSNTHKYSPFLADLNTHEQHDDSEKFYNGTELKWTNTELIWA